MPENLKDILTSLLPLILIIFISWFFSFLGPKVKKQAEEGTPAGTGESRSELLDIFLDRKTPQGPPPPEMPGPTPAMPSDAAAPVPLPRYTGPTVSPDPIKPKWWGA